MDNSSSNSKMLLKVSTIDNNSVSSSFEEQGGAMTTADLDRYSEESIEDLKATAYNLEDGKVVKTLPSYKNNQKINIRNMARGMYTVTVKTVRGERKIKFNLK